MGSSENVVRCAVVNARTKLHSGPWRFWTRKNDLYFAPSDMGGIIKASLHVGCWQVAFTDNHWRSGEQPRNAPGPGRIVWRIEHQPPFVDGVQHAWFIDIPPNSLLSNDQLKSKVKKLTTLDDVGPRINVFICDPSVPDRPPTSLTRNPLRLDDGRLAWIAYYPRLVPPFPEDGMIVTRVIEFVRPVEPGDTPGFRVSPASIGVRP